MATERDIDYGQPVEREAFALHKEDQLTHVTGLRTDLGHVSKWADITTQTDPGTGLNQSTSSPKSFTFTEKDKPLLDNLKNRTISILRQELKELGHAQQADQIILGKQRT